MNSGSNLLDQIRKEKLYNALVFQLNKDFERAGLEAEFDATFENQQLLRNLQAALYNVVVSDFESYLTLLYAIDVSEAKIKALPDCEVHQLAEFVSVLILEREFKKVQFKNRT